MSGKSRRRARALTLPTSRRKTENIDRDLQPLLLSNVRPLGVVIGIGAYGCVEKVQIPGAVCAAKKIAGVSRLTGVFVKECHLMRTLHHPNIVDFLGVCYLPGSTLPALVTELLATSLHTFLESEAQLQSPSTSHSAISIGLKLSILRDIGRGLSYLHGQSPAIIHQNLSAKNVLLTSHMVAKIKDVAMVRIVATTPVKSPRSSIYLPPEVLQFDKTSETGKAYSRAPSVDIFALGVVAIFILTQTYPSSLLLPSDEDEEKEKQTVRTELQRRDKYMQKIYSELMPGHPLILMIEECLHDIPVERPSIHEVLQRLEQAGDDIGDYRADLSPTSPDLQQVCAFAIVIIITLI